MDKKRRTQRNVALFIENVNGRGRFLGALKGSQNQNESADGPVDISFIYANPDYGSPYLGFAIKAPTPTQSIETYFDKNGRAQFQIVDFRFFTGQFSWRYKHIRAGDLDSLKQFIQTPTGQGLLNIEIRLNHGSAVDVYGFPWPSGLQPSISKDLRTLIGKQNFHIIVPSLVEPYLFQIAQGLGQNGNIQPLEHLQPLGRPM
jgi:hypothetical protein